MGNPSLEICAKQQLALTPRLQQSVKLLQLSALEFTQQIEQALSSNPFLEEIEPPEYSALSTTSVDDVHLNGVNAEGSSATAEELPGGDAGAEQQVRLLQDAADGYYEYSGSYGSGGHSAFHDGDGTEAGDWLRPQPSLREHLHEQLRICPLGDRDRALCELIIEALDDDGYLRQSLDDLAAQIKTSPPLTSDELSCALTRIQHFEPAGIAARSLAECLVLQLRALPASEPPFGLEPSLLRNAERLAASHLERLARREHALLQQELGCDAAALQQMVALIRRLDPRPGARFCSVEEGYVIPDVIVHKAKNNWVVTINPAVMPRARLHRAYIDMLQKSRCSSHAPLAQQLQEARWLIRNAEQRFATIRRVAEAIVAHQRRFFDYGEVALKPLVLRDLADELGLHESTVSRATGNKYMATPSGIYEFKHFFSRQLATDTGGSCSAASVRALIREMIDSEAPTAPLSDVRLTRLLADQGVLVARRTVAKYRNLMRIPPAELRRN